MNSREQIADLVEFNIWANRAAADSIAGAGAEVPAALRAFSHLLNAERLWLDRIDGDSTPSDVWTSSSLESCRAAIDANALRLAALIERVDEEELDRSIAYRSLAGAELSTPLREILTHMVLHAMYHRGQIATAVRQAGGTPASTDYVLFARARTAVGKG